MVETFHGGCCSNGCLLGYYNAKDKFVQMFQRNMLSPSLRSLNQVQVAAEGIWKQKYVNYLGRLEELWPSRTKNSEEVTDTMLCTQNLLSFPFNSFDLFLPITSAAT